MLELELALPDPDVAPAEDPLVPVDPLPVDPVLPAPVLAEPEPALLPILAFVRMKLSLDALEGAVLPLAVLPLVPVAPDAPDPPARCTQPVTVMLLWLLLLCRELLLCDDVDCAAVNPTHANAIAVTLPTQTRRFMWPPPVLDGGPCVQTGFRKRRAPGKRGSCSGSERGRLSRRR